jgi:hypothetical protein
VRVWVQSGQYHTKVGGNPTRWTNSALTNGIRADGSGDWEFGLDLRCGRRIPLCVVTSRCILCINFRCGTLVCIPTILPSNQGPHTHVIPSNEIIVYRRLDANGTRRLTGIIVRKTFDTRHTIARSPHRGILLPHRKPSPNSQSPEPSALIPFDRAEFLHRVGLPPTLV